MPPEQEQQHVHQNPTSADYVADLIKSFMDNGIRVWIDGGWGIDALLGEQTRLHQDLDLAVALDDVKQTGALLSNRGYAMYQDEVPTRLPVIYLQYR